MTEKQAEKLRLKIKQIKAALAADKKRWGGFYDDSGGYRYLPPQYYVKLEDWAGGMRYFQWFHKNFPDDTGYPDFLFEWALVLFKSGKLKLAEQKVFHVFCANTYVLDKFFGRPIIALNKRETSNLEAPGFTEYFTYSHTQANLQDFAGWLAAFMATDKFVTASQTFIDLRQRLETEENAEIRSQLAQAARQLKEDF